MLEAARGVSEMTSGRTFEEYLGDRIRLLAVDRQLTVLGEAARRVSASFREEHPEVPWRSIIGLRNFLLHEYGHVDREIVWKVVSGDLPALIQVLETMVPPPPEEET